MPDGDSFTLSDLAQRLGVAQHRLIHLCEKGVVTPELGDAHGRGSTRLFSARNFLELAVALRLRDMMLPVSAVRAIVQVLQTFERRLSEELPGFSLPHGLREDQAPDLRIVLSDGHSIFFSLGRGAQEAKLFGGIPLQGLIDDTTEQKIRMNHRPTDTTRRQGRQVEADGFGGPEGSEFARLELSVTQVARGLTLG